ncbi:MAG: DegT/DnrJ/EryC1/StrS family aminotransferase [Chthoniobacterales bacterium]|nr:DegT/DnrJ/EryC1/StrS family aminotransferase [Chthoniobacterales bacterium]
MNLTRERTDSYWQYEAAVDLELPVAKPQLPLADEILPYLRRIDQSRWYSNGGPLVQEFEARLAAQTGEGAVATVANATIGLTLALLTHDLAPGSLCMVPAWTFAATGHAIEHAGLVPWIVDVDPESWALEPDAARELLREAPGPISAVMPVSPFGHPIDFAAWSSFRDETGVAVVIDAAAMFDTIQAGSVPAVVSLHATKVLGVGEGGFVVTDDAGFIQELQKRANFGFWGSREATAPSLNGKMSEYTAAVGLAALDTWETTRADFARVAVSYREALAGQGKVILQEGFGGRWVSSTVMVAAADAGAEAVGRELAAHRIGTRRWWGGGLHRHGAFAKFPRGRTQQTEDLANSVLGLPCWRDLPNDKIRQICEFVIAAAG